MNPSDADLDRRFGGIARLYGEAALERFRHAHVCVIGVGGVGSWAVEALARSAVGKLTLIDLDNVAESNTNRQLPALDPHYGRAKVSVLAERVRAINPACEVEEIEDFVEEGNLEAMLGRGYDFVIDAIDNLRVKTAMAAWCVKRRQPFIVSGGAGGQMDPTLIRVADLGEVTYDPLLSKLRYNLRRHHGFPREAGKKLHVPCVFSTEQLVYPDAPSCDVGERGPQGLSCAGFGASMAVTASFGLAAAAHALKALAKSARKA
ncbi:tRNA threonylcarbamoyladenosine dehydratase [Pseudogulbenkiania subflava]|uniref:tRNA A37 threonylcarbamoyladenosine dehydratase n=1 Tax=Pseudogulbenkiania subflava DSM 22618 TaxID=1123014 RepID=A0A1Y6B5A0_9NEIS|nr:tRNA threonylcarbamoyladenosine dehydratase [Pseudogulbenkiania subflava]SME92981.1 tRNA A37 threonylcarbamoyladenosine dehydratase [Pseudogulbenkiania subflava DSM 22618]